MDFIRPNHKLLLPTFTHLLITNTKLKVIKVEMYVIMSQFKNENRIELSRIRAQLLVILRKAQCHLTQSITIIISISIRNMYIIVLCPCSHDPCEWKLFE